jgi:hypothetical protein
MGVLPNLKPGEEVLVDWFWGLKNRPLLQVCVLLRPRTAALRGLGNTPLYPLRE